MEVEVPHHPIETKRDFFIHLFTITCGLLIALALEGTVEWAHHRSLVGEARSNIRQELKSNQEATTKNLASIDRQLSAAKADLATEHRLIHNAKHFHGSLSFGYSWNDTSDAAWETARDTGALGYMPYNEVQRYADVYREQAEVAGSEKQIYSDDARAFAPLAEAENDVDTLGREQVQRMIDATADIYTHLTFLKQVTAQLRDQYGKTLASH